MDSYPLRAEEGKGAPSRPNDFASMNPETTETTNMDENRTSTLELTEAQQRIHRENLTGDVDEDLFTPLKSFQNARSLSLDSFMSESVSSLDGAGILSCGEQNRSGIGSASLLDGHQLSPILRSSEFGVNRQEINEDVAVALKRTIEGQGNILASEDAVSDREESTNPRDVGVSNHLETKSSEEREQILHEESSSPTSSESFISVGSTREEEIQLAQRQIGASAQAFIQGLRGAAHRRKMNLTRSRDSLAAKEKERREEALRYVTQKAQNVEEAKDEEVPTDSHHFRAKPVPKTTGTGGAAGLFGVPKVAKRPTTVPASPMLGSRRASLGVQGRKDAPVPIVKKDSASTTFHARRIPKAVTDKGNAGQAGLPKVQKRPSTVPFSPLLGARRPSTVGTRRHSTAVSNRPNSTNSDCVPLGLAFVNESENEENAPAVNATSKKHPDFKEFQLQSTVRAQKRAAFDEARKERWEARQLEDSRQRKERIHRLERLLGELRWEL